MNNRWYVSRPRQHDAAARIFCFHHAGGSAATFRPWHAAVPPDVEVCAVELPGHSTRFREPLERDLDTLLDPLVDGLLPALRRGPFALFGHSMGALLAYEVARRIEPEGLSPSRLYVAAYRGPRLPGRRRRVHDLPEESLVEELRRLNGTPPQVLEDPEMLELMLPIVRADFAVCETYEHREMGRVTCSLTALGGVDDRSVHADQLQAWADHTAGPFELRMQPGDHFFPHARNSRVALQVGVEVLALS